MSNLFRNVTDLSAQPVSENGLGECRGPDLLRYLDFLAAVFVFLNSVTLVLELEMEGRAARVDMLSPTGPRQTDSLRPYWRALDGCFDSIFLLEPYQ